MVEVGQSALDLLTAAGCQLFFPKHYVARGGAELEDLLENKEAVLATQDRYTSEVFNSPKTASLKMVSRWGVGYDAIDVAAATRSGVVVGYTPGLLDETVADLTFAMMLGIARRIHEANDGMRRGIWSPLWGGNVHGKTLGLVGCGRIGQAVARRALGFAMKLVAFDVAPSPQAKELGIEFVSLDQLLEQSDFVSLHAAVTPENKGMIGQDQFSRMKRTAYFINAGRGALVDESALAKALVSGQIAGAAVDTYQVEPLPPESPLASAPNTLLTPHQASFTRETGLRVGTVAAQAILDLMHGKRPQFVVNPEVFEQPSLRTQVS